MPFIQTNTNHVATVEKVPYTSSCVLLATINYNRVGLTLYNESNSTCYVAFNTDASYEVYTMPLLPRSFYELPKGYTGSVSGIWAQNSSGTGSGSMLVTEY